jgi:predicted dehydrogenase
LTIGVAVVGAGLIGSRRAELASVNPGSRLVAVADLDLRRAEELGGRLGCPVTDDWTTLLDRPEVEAVVVSTVNKHLSAITVAALDAGRHVLCEKPPGRTLAEAAAMAEAATRNGRVLKFGFNLRFHRGLRMARSRCAEGAIGDLFFVRAIYGHGGRQGMAAEWRGNADLAGGGELLDQGVHLVDLARWFLGDLELVSALTPRWFWEIGELEDNVFLLLKSPESRVASLQASWTQWRNRFDFEVVGSAGMIRVQGLGGSYGTEALTVAKRREGSEPEEETTVFETGDESWAEDWADFLAAIGDGRQPEVDGLGGLAVMTIVDAAYRSRSAGGGSITVPAP